MCKNETFNIPPQKYQFKNNINLLIELEYLNKLQIQEIMKQPIVYYFNYQKIFNSI